MRTNEWANNRIKSHSLSLSLSMERLPFTRNPQPRPTQTVCCRAMRAKAFRSIEMYNNTTGLPTKALHRQCRVMLDALIFSFYPFATTMLFVVALTMGNRQSAWIPRRKMNEFGCLLQCKATKCGSGTRARAAQQKPWRGQCGAISKPFISTFGAWATIHR